MGILRGVAAQEDTADTAELGDYELQPEVQDGLRAHIRCVGDAGAEFHSTAAHVGQTLTSHAVSDRDDYFVIFHGIGEFAPVGFLRVVLEFMPVRLDRRLLIALDGFQSLSQLRSLFVGDAQGDFGEAPNNAAGAVFNFFKFHLYLQLYPRQ